MAERMDSLSGIDVSVVWCFSDSFVGALGAHSGLTVKQRRERSAMKTTVSIPQAVSMLPPYRTAALLGDPYPGDLLKILYVHFSTLTKPDLRLKSLRNFRNNRVCLARAVAYMRHFDRSKRHVQDDRADCLDLWNGSQSLKQRLRRSALRPSLRGLQQDLCSTG